MNTYHTIHSAVFAETKEKGSKFLAFAQPVFNLEEVRVFLDEVRILHPKATHHCYAYRLGLDKQQNYRANDDGEPSGTAGRPILGQIDSKGLSNVIVIVVRYFGGTKLGVPGLISAYKGAAAAVLNAAEVVERQVMNHYRLDFGYEQMNNIMKLLKRENAVVTQQNFDDKCSLYFSLPLAQAPLVENALADIPQTKISLLNSM